MPLNRVSKYSELTETQYAAIGQIVVEWSNIEYLLSLLLSRLLRTPEFLGRIYAAGLSAVRIQDAIKAAVEIHRRRYDRQFIDEATLAAIETVNGRVSAMRVERNRVSHFCWCRATDEEVFGTDFAAGMPTETWDRRHSRSLTLRELRRIHKEERTVTDELLRITTTIPAIDEQ